MYSLIIVDYNTIDNTVRYIKEIFDKIVNQDAFHVVIVDNGTSQNTPADLTVAFEKEKDCFLSSIQKPVLLFRYGQLSIAYCRSGANLGYAKGNNLGAEIAKAFFSDPYYIFSNNDLKFEHPLDLSGVSAVFESNPQVAILGPDVVGLDNIRQSPRKKQSAFTKLIAFYWAMFLGGITKKWIDDIDYAASTGDCDWVMGCFMFVRSDAFWKVEGFDPNTFLYAEELILSEKMLHCGYRTFFYQPMKVIHAHSVTVKKSISVIKNAAISFQSNCYYYQHYRNTSPVVMRLAKWNFSVYKVLYFAKQPIKRLVGIK